MPLGPLPTGLTPSPDSESIERGIRSFHRLSAAGPSGFRPSHLQEALKTETRDELVEHTTSLVALLTRGEALRQVAPFLAGASLTALPKKDGGVRPIAVGETLRRLSAKFLCSTHTRKQLATSSSRYKLAWPSPWALKSVSKPPANGASATRIAHLLFS